MLQPRYVLYSFYEEDGFRNFIYWDTKNKKFAISENRKAGIMYSGVVIFITSLMDYFGIKISSGPHINNGVNWWLLIIIPLISLLVFKVLYFIQNNKEKDFQDINTNNVDTLMKIIYETRKDMTRFFIRGEGCALICLYLWIWVVPLNQLDNVFLFYILEALVIVAPFIFYIPGYKIAKELKQQYPLTK